MTYIVRKKGGRNRTAHVNRLKFYDPKNSNKDPEVNISVEEDEPANDILNDNLQSQKENDTKNKIHKIPVHDDNMRMTRSKTKELNNNKH